MNIDDKISEFSEMKKSERDFIRGIILEYKPKKILEVGIAAGSTSAIILDTIKDMDSHLYSVDLRKNHYKRKDKSTGFVVDEFPELKHKWTLNTGKIVCNYLDEIGGDIDLCILDTVHSNPGEFLDYLQVLPYLKENAVLIIHDINYHINFKYPDHFTCGNLFSVIKGQKFLPEYTEHGYFPNIGACVLDKNINDNVFDVFNCLTQPWTYKLSTVLYNELICHYKKHYDAKIVEFFEKAFEYNMERLGFWKRFSELCSKMNLLCRGEIILLCSKMIVLFKKKVNAFKSKVVWYYNKTISCCRKIKRLLSVLLIIK